MAVITTDAALWEQWRQARPDLDLSSMQVIGALKHTLAMLELVLEPAFEGVPITASEFDVLIHLRHAGGPTIARRLAGALGRSAAALSKSLARLEDRGLVVREDSAADRRAALVSITDEGADAVDTVMTRRLAREAALLAGLSKKRRAEIVAALTELRDLVDRQARDQG